MKLKEDADLVSISFIPFKLYHGLWVVTSYSKTKTGSDFCTAQAAT